MTRTAQNSRLTTGRQSGYHDVTNIPPGVPISHVGMLRGCQVKMRERPPAGGFLRFLLSEVPAAPRYDFRRDLLSPISCVPQVVVVGNLRPMHEPHDHTTILRHFHRWQEIAIARKNRNNVGSTPCDHGRDIETYLKVHSLLLEDWGTVWRHTPFTHDCTSYLRCAATVCRKPWARVERTTSVPKSNLAHEF